MARKEEYVLTVRLPKKDEEIVKRLKNNYSINISQYLRNKLVELDKKFKKKIGDEL